MQRDIENRQDIDRLMQHFYRDAIADEEIGFIFTDMVKLDLEHHLPIIGDFWETLLFRSGDYPRHGRNPLQVHIELDKKIQLTREHFQRWLEIFSTTVDSLFAGEAAEFIKMRAAAIAVRMLEALGAAHQGRPTVPIAAAAER